MIVGTHEMGFAREVGNRVIFTDDGIIVGKGTPQEIFFNIRNERTKSFLSKILLHFLTKHKKLNELISDI